MTQQLGLFDVADCIKGGIRTSIGNDVREAGTTRSKLTGETGFDLIGKLSKHLPKGVNDKMRGIRSAFKKFKGTDTADSIFYTNILLNPATAERNMIGTTAQAILDSGTRSLRGLAEGNLKQAVAQFEPVFDFKNFSLGDGVNHAWNQAGKAWAAGRPLFIREKKELLELAARGDMEGIKKWYKVVPKIMGATDDFFTTLGYHMELHDQVYRAATKRVGGQGADAIKKEVIHLLNHVPDEIKRASELEARKTVFRDIGATGFHKLMLDTFTGIQQKTPFGLGKFAVPFVRTPVNLAKRGLEYSPANMLYGFGQILKSGNTRGQMNVYRGLMGTSLMSWFGYHAYNGNISGDGSTLTPGERSAKMATGWQPSAFKVSLPGMKDKWYSYRNFGPVTTMMTVAGNVGERARDTGILSMETYFNEDSSIITDHVKGVLDSTFLPSLIEYGSALMFPERYGRQGMDNLFRTLRSQVVPSGVPSFMRAIDPTVRKSADIGDQLTSPVKALKGDQPRLGLFGEELSRTGAFSDNFVDIFLNPARATQIVNDPLIQEIARFQEVGLEGAGFSAPSINDKDLGFKEDTLSKEEILLGSKAKGFVQRFLVEKMFQSPGYLSLADEIKLRVLRKQYDKAGRITNERIRNLKRRGKPLTFRDITVGFQ